MAKIIKKADIYLKDNETEVNITVILNGSIMQNMMKIAETLNSIHSAIFPNAMIIESIYFREEEIRE